MTDVCIYCGEELVLWEQRRSYCSKCHDSAEISYADDMHYTEDELHHDDYYIDENEEFRYHL
jgi:hypothetical protein